MGKLIGRLVASLFTYLGTWETAFHLWLTVGCLVSVTMVVPVIEPIKTWADILR